MSQRTGTQLKTDVVAADAALATAVATPNQTNIQAAITAFTTVRQNAADSVATIKTSDISGQQIARDIQAHANAVIRELNSILAKFSNASAAELKVLLQDVKRRLDASTYNTVVSKPTTT